MNKPSCIQRATGEESILVEDLGMEAKLTQHDDSHAEVH